MLQVENQPFSISDCNPKKQPLRLSIEQTISQKKLRRRVSSSSSSTSLSLDSLETASMCSPNGVRKLHQNTFEEFSFLIDNNVVQMNKLLLLLFLKNLFIPYMFGSLYREDMFLFLFRIYFIR